MIELALFIGLLNIIFTCFDMVYILFKEGIEDGGRNLSIGVLLVVCVVLMFALFLLYLVSDLI